MRKHRVGIHDLVQRQVSLDLLANISFRAGRCQPASFSTLAKAFVSFTFRRLLCSSLFLNLSQTFQNLLFLFPRICTFLIQTFLKKEQNFKLRLICFQVFLDPQFLLFFSFRFQDEFAVSLSKLFLKKE